MPKKTKSSKNLQKSSKDNKITKSDSKPVKKSSKTKVAEKKPKKKTLKKTVTSKKKIKPEIEFLSFTAFAKELGTTRDKLRTALENGIFSDDAYSVKETASGKRYAFNPELAFEEWKKYIPNRKITKPALSSPDELDKSDDLNDPDKESQIDILAGNYDVYRSWDMKYRAKKSKLEYEALAGKYVDFQEVRKVAMKIAKSVKDAFLKLPGKVVTKIMDVESIHEQEQIILAEVNAILAGLDWRVVQEKDIIIDEEIK